MYSLPPCQALPRPDIVPRGATLSPPSPSRVVLSASQSYSSPHPPPPPCRLHAGRQGICCRLGIKIQVQGPLQPLSSSLEPNFCPSWFRIFPRLRGGTLVTWAMWELSLSLGRPSKQQVLGSFSVWEQREHSGKWKVPEQSSCCRQGHERHCPRRPHALRCSVVRLPGAARLTTAGQGALGSGHRVPCTGSSCGWSASVLPAPAQPPHAHRPASSWKSACVP